MTVRDYAPGNVKLVITPVPPAAEPMFSPARSRHAYYFAAVQQAILQSICHSDITVPGRYRLAIKLWVEPSGAVAAVKFLDTTGDAARDRMLSVDLEHMEIGVPPPPDMRQPITLMIQPQSAHGVPACGDAGGETRQTSN
jgi:hypothetical protein